MNFESERDLRKYFNERSIASDKIPTMLVKIYWSYLVVFLYHQVTSLQPNYCEFFDEVFEYVPRTVTVQERNERKKEGIGAFLDPRNLLNRNAYKNVTKTEMVAVKRMRSYVSCCLGFVKIEGECVSKSSQSTKSRPPTPASSLGPPSSTSPGPYASVSTETVSKPSDTPSPIEKKDTSSGESNKAFDEAVTEDQREEIVPAAIRLNHGHPLMDDELEIPETEDEVDQSSVPTFIQR